MSDEKRETQIRDRVDRAAPYHEAGLSTQAGSDVRYLLEQLDETRTERDAAYEWLRTWQKWSADLHHEYEWCDELTLPDDTKARTRIERAVDECAELRADLARVTRERDEAEDAVRSLRRVALAFVERHQHHGSCCTFDDRGKVIITEQSCVCHPEEKHARRALAETLRFAAIRTRREREEVGRG